jgi:hypothetical protein
LQGDKKTGLLSFWQAKTRPHSTAAKHLREASALPRPAPGRLANTLAGLTAHRHIVSFFGVLLSTVHVCQPNDDRGMGAVLTAGPLPPS